MNDQQTFLNYFVLAFVVHLMVLITLTTVHFTSDVTKSGDLDMDVQIFIMKQEINPVEETNIAESIEKKIEEKVDEQQVIMDNRKAGDKTVQTFDTWHGRVRQIIDSNKSYPLLSRQRKEEGTAVVKFTILKNGKVFHKFNPFFADGFRVDKDDNVWTSAGKGIKCFNPQGEVIGQLLLPDLVANLTFGGENNNILYVTSSSNLYSMELNQQGK